MSKENSIKKRINSILIAVVFDLIAEVFSFLTIYFRCNNYDEFYYFITQVVSIIFSLVSTILILIAIFKLKKYNKYYEKACGYAIVCLIIGVINAVILSINDLSFLVLWINLFLNICEILMIISIFKAFKEMLKQKKEDKLIKRLNVITVIIILLYVCNQMLDRYLFMDPSLLFIRIPWKVALIISSICALLFYILFIGFLQKLKK